MSVPESRRLPRNQVDGVVKALYAAADQLDWEHLPASNRTAQYDSWITDPEIGGVLTRYMTSENARSWIKDGPMKEYGRARLGAGRYAKFGTTVGPSSEQVVRQALGEESALVPNSEGIKPFHCLATMDQTTAYIAWDTGKNLRHLVWATINHLASHPDHKACIVILESIDRPTVRADRIRHERIADRCSIEIKYYRVVPRRKDGDEA